MLKKAGIAVAIATAGLLALSPVAFAHEQESNQQSFKDNGVGHGNKAGKGNKAEACNVSTHTLNAPNNTVSGRDTHGAECKTKGESIGSNTKQHHNNNNDD